MTPKPLIAKALKIGVLFVALLVTTGGTLLYLKSPKQAILSRTMTRTGSGQLDLQSAPFTLDKVYTSMQGPRSNQGGLQLREDAAAEEVLWLTGLQAEVREAETQALLSPEFFCHSNLTFSPKTITPAAHNASFQPARHMDWRLFTLVPGMMNVQLPPGFGIPVHGGTLLDHFTMALNQNEGQPVQKVQMRSRVSFTKDRAGMKPVFRRALYVYQQHQKTAAAADTSLGISSHTSAHQGETCGESCASLQKGAAASTFSSLFKTEGGNIHPGATCCIENASPEGIVPQFGNENTVHWMVPPGSHRYRSEVTAQMALPDSTTAHYINGHLHPYAKSMDLMEMETGKIVFHITSEDYQDRLGVRQMSSITSMDGIPLVKGRRYELVADYANPTPHAIDAMAILYVYLLEPDATTSLAQK